MVTTITLWNKVSPIFPYLDDIRSGADDGQVRVSSARSEGSLQIFTVGVSVRRCSWLSFVVAISTLLSICSTTRFVFFNPLCLVVKDCKPVLLWVFPQPMFFHQLLDIVASKRVVFAVFKALCGDDVCRCPFPLLSFQCVFQATVDDEQSDEEDD
jgi:hypothetical protein